ncbi:hypothetical protein [Alteromonas facilis]|uniref:hypothetical protein n=1 Tax=Alteromonas facilis TaxID=2048004 RepID=UPI000C293F68|nr:hypothetical protein [Alteromonas facilis]
MDIESSIVAAQNALVVNPSARQTERAADAREQQQRAQTQLPPQQTVVRQASTEAYEQAEQFRKRNRSGYDAPSAQAQAALDTYQSLQRESRREEIRGMLGIDLYA